MIFALSDISRSSSKRYYTAILNFNEWRNVTHYATGNALTICTKGWAKGELNMQEYLITEGCVMWIFKDFLVRCTECSEDFNMIVMGFIGDTFSNLATGLETDVLLRSFRHVTKITDTKIFDTIHSFALTAKMVCQLPDQGHNDEIIHMLIRSSILLQYNFLAQQENVPERTGYTSADNIAYQFVELLRKHSKTEHEVFFYAKTLGVSAKYLNEISQAKLHRKAKDVISKYVAAQIRRDILYSGKNIKTLALEYNFGDQSSLGKFFKRQTGASPATFRKAIENEPHNEFLIETDVE